MLDMWYQPRQAEVVRMTAEVPVSQGLAPRPVNESVAWSAPGVRTLVAGVVTALAGIALLAVHSAVSGDWILIAAGGIVPVLARGLLFSGLTAVVVQEARVVQLFGRYRGTIRDPGLHWVNPFARRLRVSTRIRNHETAVAKVNDADGNPIEIAAVVVWQVRDTAKAIYAVDEYPKFIAIQTEAAVRHTASSYPYTSLDGHTLSLRDNAEEITQRLSAEIAERVRPAGVHIVESRLTRLSYAAEIAQAMLR